MKTSTSPFAFSAAYGAGRILPEFVQGGGGEIMEIVIRCPFPLLLFGRAGVQYYYLEGEGGLRKMKWLPIPCQMVPLSIVIIRGW